MGDLALDNIEMLSDWLDPNTKLIMQVGAESLPPSLYKVVFLLSEMFCPSLTISGIFSHPGRACFLSHTIFTPA